MRLIDADALLKELKQEIEEHKKERKVLIDNDFLTLIHDAPTVDAVELVRCKDCKKTLRDNGHKHHVCSLNGSAVKDSDFCSKGERSEE